MGSLSKRRRNAVAEAFLRQKGRCFYCRCPLSAENMTADHKKPACKGGTVSRENIAAACHDCNQMKADLPESYFFKLITARMPPRKSSLWMIWASRRIWRRANRACEKIERLAA